MRGVGGNGVSTRRRNEGCLSRLLRLRTLVALVLAVGLVYALYDVWASTRDAGEFRHDVRQEAASRRSEEEYLRRGEQSSAKETEKPLPNINEHDVVVLLWDVPKEASRTWAGFMQSGTFETPNYLGARVEKGACSTPCYVTNDRRLLARADVVLFEPVFSRRTEWRRTPPEIPEKRPWQLWALFGYETGEYFPLYDEPLLRNRIDILMTYDQTGEVPVTFVCPWGGGDLGQFRTTPRKKTDHIAFVASNCDRAGADRRTAYVAELMKYTEVHSFGRCLHNKEFPSYMAGKVYTDHGTAMRNKVKLFSSYKYVLAFENNNITDYVTEKVVNALQAGSVPIYMGAAEIDDWVPDPKAVIRTDQFKSPYDLALYIYSLDQDTELYHQHLDWRAHPLPQRFVDKYEKCVFFNSECRLCEYAERHRPSFEAFRAERNSLEPDAFAIELDAQSTYVSVPGDTIALQLDDVMSDLTVSAWIYFQASPGGTILSYFDRSDSTGLFIELVETCGRNYVELCTGDGCVRDFRPLLERTWYHVSVSYGIGQIGIQFFVNGRRTHIETNNALLHLPRVGAATLFIGGDPDPRTATSPRFFGYIDDVVLWRRSLGEHEVQRHMYSRDLSRDEGLVSAWRFNDPTSTIVRDESGNQADAVIGGRDRRVPNPARPIMHEDLV